MLCPEVTRYLASSVSMPLASAASTPFFYLVGDTTYERIINELKELNVKVVRVSDFCPKDDKFPDIDKLIGYFRTLDIDCSQNKFVLVGLGECMALKGTTYSDRLLQRLNNTKVGSAKIVLLLRCITQQALCSLDDSRIVAQNRLFKDGEANSSITLTCTRFGEEDAILGMKRLLRCLEDGRLGNVLVKTSLNLDESLIPITYINTWYKAIQNIAPLLDLPESIGESDQWEQFYHELNRFNGVLDELFASYHCADDVEDNIYQKCAGVEFRNWLYFISLKQNTSRIRNDYLAYVISITSRFSELRENLLNAINNIPRTDENFIHMYEKRKLLIKDFPEYELKEFIANSQTDPIECVYRYTDNTKAEREAIIVWVAQHGYNVNIARIYPDLNRYLSDYNFVCGDLSDLMTNYFHEYRLAKVTNRIPEDFIGLVERNAQKLPYAHLEPRDSAILKVSDKKDAFLYWVDALGVEYIPYIVTLAKELDLKIHIDITRADLPTITSINKRFFEEWNYSAKKKESRLDEIKHKDKGTFFYEPGQAAVHLASELEIIKEVLESSALMLRMQECKTVVIASDHGASRLAVIHHQDEKYETDTRGEHSGRCCKYFPDNDLPHSIVENGYIVLTDYGRFKNSRTANVEVHGGATLEEVVVPVISLSLPSFKINVKLIDENEIYCDRHNGTTICLYISFVENVQDVYVDVDNKRYYAKSQENRIYCFHLQDLKRSKNHVKAYVHDGDVLIDTVSFDIKSKLASSNSDFDLE